MEPSATGRGARPRGLGRAVTVRSLLGTRDFLTVLDPTPLNQRGQPILDPVCEHLDMRCGFLPNRRQRIFHMRWHHGIARSEEHTSELQSLMRISYSVFCLKKTHNLHSHSSSA